MGGRTRLVVWSVAVCVAASVLVPSMAAAAVRLEDDDTRLSYAGTWRSVHMYNASGTSYRVAEQPAASVTATFEGTRVSLIGRMGPDRGQARVTLDGTVVADIDTYFAERTSQQTMWDSGVLAAGTHVVTVESLGSKNAAASGTSVVVDAFEIEGTAVQGATSGVVIESGDSRLARLGSWWVSKRRGASGGKAWRTKAKGASVTVRFSGTGIAWLGRKDHEGGWAEVLLDGKKIAKVSQYRATVAEGAVGYAISGLSAGNHTLVVRALGTKGSGGGRKVDVDRFVVAGTPVKAYAATPFRYPWKNYIVVDKSEYQLYWVKNGSVIKVYPIAHGKVGWTTPSRVWRVGAKYKTDPGSVYGPRKMRMYKRVGRHFVRTAYAIHGTNQEWVIGTRASHGCIRMYNKDVRELWPQVPIGTMVVTRD